MLDLLAVEELVEEELAVLEVLEVLDAPAVLDVLEVDELALLLAVELVAALELLEFPPPPHAANRTAPPTSPSARSPLPKPMDIETHIPSEPCVATPGGASCFQAYPGHIKKMWQRAWSHGNERGRVLWAICPSLGSSWPFVGPNGAKCRSAGAPRTPIALGIARQPLAIPESKGHMVPVMQAR